MFNRDGYMFAIYDKNDQLCDVFDNMGELSEYLKRADCSLWNAVKKNRTVSSEYKIRKIECFEIHDDIFKEEDQIFQEMFKNNYSVQKRIKSLGLKERTYFRKKKAFENDKSDTRIR